MRKYNEMGLHELIATLEHICHDNGASPDNFYVTLILEIEKELYRRYNEIKKELEISKARKED